MLLCDVVGIVFELVLCVVLLIEVGGVVVEFGVVWCECEICV